MSINEITKSGLKWLKIDVANCFGYDKATHAEQVVWVDENYETLEALASQADTPYEYLNAVQALRDADSGRVVDHYVYLDCSNQALQIYGVGARDYATAYTCNLSSGSNRQDAYGMLAKAMNDIVGTDMFTRKLCKKPFMTTLYGKQKAYESIFDELQTTEEQFCIDHNLPLMHNDDTTTIGHIFNEAMYKIAPKAMEVMDNLQALNDENIGTYYWVMPDGFKVKYDVKKTLEYEGNRISRGGIEFNFTCETTVYEPHKYNAGMAPNVIHSIDGYICRLMIERMKAEGRFITTIHDAYACHPNDAERMIEIYKEIIIELLHSNILDDIMAQIANGRYYQKVEYTNDLTEQHINESEYSLS
jgi:DNA-directed RNA polymerase